jgi:hypothetical protein
MDKRKDKINSALPTRSAGGRYLGIATQSAPNGAGWEGTIKGGGQCLAVARGAIILARS